MLLFSLLLICTTATAQNDLLSNNSTHLNRAKRNSLFEITNCARIVSGTRVETVVRDCINSNYVMVDGVFNFSEAQNDPLKELCNSPTLRSIRFGVHLTGYNSTMDIVSFCGEKFLDGLWLKMEGTRVKNLNLAKMFVYTNSIIRGNKFLSAETLGKLQEAKIIGLQKPKECMTIDNDDLDDCDWVYGNWEVRPNYVQKKDHRVKGFEGCLRVNNSHITSDFFSHLDPDYINGHTCHDKHEIRSCISKTALEKLTKLVNGKIVFYSLDTCMCQSLSDSSKVVPCKMIDENLTVTMQNGSLPVKSFYGCLNVNTNLSIDAIFDYLDNSTIHGTECNGTHSIHACMSNRTLQNLKALVKGDIIFTNECEKDETLAPVINPDFGETTSKDLGTQETVTPTINPGLGGTTAKDSGIQETVAPTVNPGLGGTVAPTINPGLGGTTGTDSGIQETVAPTVNPDLGGTVAPTINPGLGGTTGKDSGIQETVAPTINPCLGGTVAPTINPGLGGTTSELETDFGRLTMIIQQSDSLRVETQSKTQKRSEASVQDYFALSEEFTVKREFVIRKNNVLLVSEGNKAK